MMEKLVSILTPCYNGDQFIKRYAESLLNQTYHNCQLIFMDDGSTDRTKELILQYKRKFAEKGIVLEYHYHENIGVGATIAKGIRFIKGEYFFCLDSDDVLPPNSIKAKVDFLENNKQYGLVRTNFIVAQDEPENVLIENGTARYNEREKENLFEDYLVARNMWLQPGCYMIRTSAYDDANPDRYIYPTRTGQNWQIILPILYSYKCGYMNERLFIYIRRSNSLSKRALNQFDLEKKQINNYIDLIKNTIVHMNISENEKIYYCNKVENSFIQRQVSLGFRYNNKEWALENWEKLPKEYRNFKLWVKKTFAGSKLMCRWILWLQKIILQVK